MNNRMTQPFPILKHPSTTQHTPILVSIPHYGTQPLPHISREDYCEPWFETFAYGFADTFVGDIYADLHEHGATVVATPLSRIFVDVNRRRDDFQHHDGVIRSQRGVVRTHTIRDVLNFHPAPACPRPLRNGCRASTIPITAPWTMCSSDCTGVMATPSCWMVIPAVHGV